MKDLIHKLKELIYVVYSLSKLFYFSFVSYSMNFFKLKYQGYQVYYFEFLSVSGLYSQDSLKS